MSQGLDIAALERFSSQVRRDIIRMVHAVSSGHPGGSLGCADFMTLLYTHVLRHHPEFHMDGRGEDMFFLSNGHISPVWYSVLARSGYFPVSELSTFRRIDSRLQGHPTTHEGLPGIRVASGSLGQGVSVAIGAALGKRLDQDDRLIYVLTGDGELQEGQIWEALMFAAHHKIDNLIMVIDRNGQQIDGPNHEVMNLEDLHAKLQAFGWSVLEMNGHDYNDMYDKLGEAQAQAHRGRPMAIIMTTVMGKGVDYMEGTHEWHGKAPDDHLTEIALSQLDETMGDF